MLQTHYADIEGNKPTQYSSTTQNGYIDIEAIVFLPQHQISNDGDLNLTNPLTKFRKEQLAGNLGIDRQIDK